MHCCHGKNVPNVKLLPIDHTATISIMEHIDRVAARVSMCAVAGLLGGASYATWRGFPLGTTSAKVASSVAIVGTTLFGAERLFYIALQPRMMVNETNEATRERTILLTSHTLAGITGGALNGSLYQRRPLPGMVYFTPVMIGVALLELEFQTRRQRRVDEVMRNFNEKSNHSEPYIVGDYRRKRQLESTVENRTYMLYW